MKENKTKTKKVRKPLSKWIKFPLILGIIAASSGCLIGGTYFLVHKKIEANIRELEETNLNAIYPNNEYEYETISFELEKDMSITKIWNVKSKDNPSLDSDKYIYRASKNNSYGKIDLLAGVEGVNGTIHKVKLIENTQSFTKEVDSWVNENQNAFSGDLDALDTKCGATFGAKLVQSILVEIQTHYLANRKAN